MPSAMRPTTILCLLLLWRSNRIMTTTAVEVADATNAASTAVSTTPAPAVTLLDAAILVARYPFTGCHDDRVFPSILPSLSNHSSFHPMDDTADTMRATTCTPETGLFADAGLQASLPLLTTPTNNTNNNALLTVALWMTPSPTNGHVLPLVLLGPEKGPYTCANVRIAQADRDLVVTFRDRDDACRHLRVRGVFASTTKAVGDSAVTHVVAAFGPDSLTVYVNGTAVVRNAPQTIDMAQWDGPVVPVELFVDSGDSKGLPFDGSILQLDVYDTALTDAQTAAAYAEGFTVVVPSDNTNNNNSTGATLLLNTEPVALDQDATDPVSLFLGTATAQSWNERTAATRAAIQIMALPMHGVVARTDTGETVSVGSILTFDSHIQGVSVQYTLSNTKYFNVPRHDAHGWDRRGPPEAVDYRLVTVRTDDDTDVETSSETVRLPIVVTHVSAAPALTQPTIDIAPDGMAILDGISALGTPSSTSMDYVRVDVSAAAGWLTLNHPDSISELSIVMKACRMRTLSTWQCAGTGTEDRALTIVTVPDELQDLLHGLSYTPFVPGAADEVTVRLWSGEGENCLHETEHQEFAAAAENVVTSVHRGCDMVQLNVTIPEFIVEPQSDGVPDKATFFGVDIKQLTVFGPVIVVMLLCICGYKVHLPKFLAREEKIQVGDDYDEYDEENVLPAQV